MGIMVHALLWVMPVPELRAARSDGFGGRCKIRRASNVGALIIRIGFGGILYYIL